MTRIVRDYHGYNLLPEAHQLRIGCKSFRSILFHQFKFKHIAATIDCAAFYSY